VPFQEVRPSVASSRSEVAAGSDGTTISTVADQTRFLADKAATTAAEDVVNADTCWEAGTAAGESNSGLLRSPLVDGSAGTGDAEERLTRDSSRSTPSPLAPERRAGQPGLDRRLKNERYLIECCCLAGDVAHVRRGSD